VASDSSKADSGKSEQGAGCNVLHPASNDTSDAKEAGHQVAAMPQRAASVGAGSVTGHQNGGSPTAAAAAAGDRRGGNGKPAVSSDRAARRAALLAADAAAEAEEEKLEAQRESVAAAAAAAVGVSKQEGRAWLEAARDGHLGRLQALLTSNSSLLNYQGQGTSYSFTGHAALHWAAAKGHVGCVRWLLGQGANVGQANAAGATPLHAALANAQEECAKALVVEGRASIHVQDALGESARDLALNKAQQTEPNQAPTGPSSLVRRLDLWNHVTAMRTAAATNGGTWGVRQMQQLLAHAGVPFQGAVERSELVGLCEGVMTQFPPCIQPAQRHLSPQPGSLGGAASNVHQPHQQHQQQGQLQQQQQRNQQGTTFGHASHDGREGESRKGGSMGDGWEFDSSEAAGMRGGAGSTSRADAAAHSYPENPSTGAPAGVADSRGKSDAPQQGLGDSNCEATEDAASTQQQVEAARLKGNQAFGRREYAKAVSHYTMAIRLSSAPNSVLYNNRAAAYAGMAYWGRSLEDADEVVRLEPRNVKAHTRRGTALLAMGSGRAEEAAEAFTCALKIDPLNQAAADGLEAACTVLGQVLD